MYKSKTLTVATLSFVLAGGMALAQTAGGGMSGGSMPNSNAPLAAKCGPGSMADTSSDSGNMGTGASSSKLGTGTQNTGGTGSGVQGGGSSGMMSSMAPSIAGQGAVGAAKGSCQ